MKKVFGVFLSIILAFQLVVLCIPTQSIKIQAAAASTVRASVHDPSIVKNGSKYYLFGSHLSNAVSSNLTSWSTFTTNVNTDYNSLFSKPGKWAAHGSSSYSLGGNMWAPDVIYNPTMKKWCMYMSINGDKFYSSIALATADNINGPYTYRGEVVFSGFKNASEASETDYAKVTGTNTVPSRYLLNGTWSYQYGTNAIDPCVIYDANGDLWMSYGSWFGGIYMLKLDKNTGLRDYSHTYSTTKNVSDQYMGIRISGGYGSTGEGSYITYDKASSYYYLYVSYCGLDATDSFSGYHIRLFRSKNITGPYTDAAGNTAICTSVGQDQSKKGVKLFGNYKFSSLKQAASGENSQNGYMSGGHNSALIDSDGSRYLIYHTRFNNGTEWHQVRVHQQFLNADGWPVTAVYENLGSKISSSGYTTKDIAGTYEFVNHGNAAVAQYTGMLTTSTVNLNANGTITGDYQGTWTETAGTYYCTMAIGGTTYKGVFFKQYDESASHKETMTFSLIGNNDQSIWGSKTKDAVISDKGNSTAGLDGTYYIKNCSSSLYLDVADGSSNDGANIQQWSYNGSDAQKFKLVSDGNGYYSILTGASGYKSCIDIEDGSSTDGTNVNQWNYWGGDMQKFEIVKISDGKYAIKTKCSSGASALDVYNISSEAGANIDQWTYWGGDCQLWNLVKADTVTVSPSPSTPVATVTPSVEPSTQPSQSTETGKALTLDASADGWSGGYNMSVTLKNTSSNAVTDWKVTFHTSQIKMTSAWCVKSTISDNSIVLTPEAYNANVAADGSTSFGFGGNGDKPAYIYYTVSYQMNGMWYSYSGTDSQI